MQGNTGEIGWLSSKSDVEYIVRLLKLLVRAVVERLSVGAED